MNSMPRWLLKSTGKPRCLLQSILDVPRTLKRASSSRSCSAVWPMPVPYPEVFSSSSSLVVEKVHLKRLVSFQGVHELVALGCPSAASGCLAIGSRLKARQWTAVKYVEHLCVDCNTPVSVDAAFMGRAAAKVEGMEMEAVLAALSRAGALLREYENNIFLHGSLGLLLIARSILQKRLGAKWEACKECWDECKASGCWTVCFSWTPTVWLWSFAGSRYWSLIWEATGLLRWFWDICRRGPAGPGLCYSEKQGTALQKISWHQTAETCEVMQQTGRLCFWLLCSA